MQHPKRPCFLFFFFFLIDSPVPTLHRSTLARHTFSALDTKASIPQEKQYTTGNTIIYPSGLQTRQIPLEKRTNTHTSNLHLFPTMPTTVCVSAQDGRPPLDSGSSVLHGQLLTLQGRFCNCSVLLLQDGWHHDPRDFSYSHTELLWYPWGFTVYSNAVHTCVQCLD